MKAHIYQIALNYFNNTPHRPFLSICIICAHACLKTEKVLHKSAIILQKLQRKEEKNLLFV